MTVYVGDLPSLEDRDDQCHLSVDSPRHLLTLCVCMCHISTTDPVHVNRIPDVLRSRMAMWVPHRMAVVPNQLHVLVHYPLLKLLHCGQLFFNFKL